MPGLLGVLYFTSLAIYGAELRVSNPRPDQRMAACREGKAKGKGESEGDSGEEEEDGEGQG
jgi:hypothetical protein